MKTYVVVITGASGTVYGLRLVEQLLSGGNAVTLIVTPAGREVAAMETGLTLPQDTSGGAAAVLRFLELPVSLPLRMAACDDLLDPALSGSSRIAGVLVCPASMGFCGSVANGLASDLPLRAADVMLKERRPLVLVPREAPLSLVHLRNLTSLAEAGAVVVPASPAFYSKPLSIDDLVDFVVGRILDQIGVEHQLFRRWDE